MKLKEILQLESNTNISSLKDIKNALLHLSNGEITYQKSYYNLPDTKVGYLIFTPNNSKKSLVCTFDKSDWGNDNVGIAYIDGKRTKGYEFVSIQSLYDILKKIK